MITNWDVGSTNGSVKQQSIAFQFEYKNIAPHTIRKAIEIRHNSKRKCLIVCVCVCGIEHACSMSKYVHITLTLQMHLTKSDPPGS